MRPSPPQLAALLLAALLSAGCVSDAQPDEGQSVTGAGDVPDVRAVDLDVNSTSAPEACEDFYEAASTLGGRCGFDRQALLRYYLSGLPGGDCDAVVQVDGRRPLYRDCIPGLATLSCERWQSEGFAGGCQDVSITYDETSPSPSQACRDVANAYGANAALCGQDYQAYYDSFTDAVDCRDVVEVRDRGALYERCIPAILSAPCDALDAGFGEASCEGQLLSP